MRREHVLGTMGQVQPSSRDYDTIRNAIKHGMNIGTFALDAEQREIVVYDWRLMGDAVQCKKKEHEWWSLLDKDDIDHVFSRGVHGKQVEFTRQWSCYYN